MLCVVCLKTDCHHLKFDTGEYDLTEYPIPRDPNPEFDRAVKALETVENNNPYMAKALVLVSTDYNRYLTQETLTEPSDFYVVWFAKVLGNWKALISTDVANGLYWEVTYNGNKQETYVDAYVKESNRAYKDNETL